MMRVVYASDELGPHDQRLLGALAKSPHETHLLTFYNRAEMLPDWLARECPGVTVHHRRFPAYPELPGGSRIARWRDAARYRRAFADMLKEIRPDLVHAGWVQSTGYAAALSGVHPLFLMPWGSDILVWPARSWRDRRKARIALRAADAIACDAEIVKQRIMELSGVAADRVSVFPWGVDLDRFHPAPAAPSRPPTVVMTRQMRDPYGVLDFAGAFPALRATVPEARLLLVGDGVQRPEVEAVLRPLGDCWRIAGAVDNAAMPGLLGSGDVYASNSTTDGTSVSLLEAMACALPVVVTDLPANREWITEGENGFLVPVGDAPAMTDRIAHLLADPALRKTMGARNLAIARERADWKINARKMLEGYEAAVAHHRKPAR
jgi:glycosyltransferase involved in cell wall biosynthesis